LKPGNGLLFACFFRESTAQDQSKVRGLGLFLPEIAPSRGLATDDVRDPTNLLAGASFDTVKSTKGAFTFSGAGQLSLRAKGGSMYQADLRLASGQARNGVCQGGPAGDRGNALAFFDGLNTRMTSSREANSQ
jgi:hypothetical protein